MAQVLLMIYIFIMGIAHYYLLIHRYFKIILNKSSTVREWERFSLYHDKNILLSKIEDKEVWWFNCASAGEFNTIKKLLIKLDTVNSFIVITTSTSSGAIAFDNYKHSSNNIIHLYVPYDTPQSINRFLKFWKPTKIILVESEIWPNLILQGSRFAKIYIINARLSPRSFKRWSNVKWLFKYILSHVSSIGASSTLDLHHYQMFYKQVAFTGNLKYDADPLSCNPIDLKLIEASIGDREVFVCASTHPGEEDILIRVYKRLLQSMPNLLLIIIPRHIERDEELLKLCFNYKVTSILRSEDNSLNNHIPTDTNVYIINTIGELGIAFRLGKIVFMGGSIIDVGGHNCCEPAMLECAIMSGNKMSNFIDLMEGMINANALIIASTEDEIFENAKRLFSNPEEVKQLGVNGKKFVEANSGALEKTLAIISGF